MPNLSLSELFPHASLNESTLHKSLGEEFSLCDTRNMVFHWADFHETCDVVKKHLDSHPELREEFIRKELMIIQTEETIHGRKQYKFEAKLKFIDDLDKRIFQLEERIRRNSL